MLKVAVDQIQNWIFITGAIRSGTTFVGDILSSSWEVDYIHEPFNPQCGIPGFNSWYPYIRPSLDTQDMQHYHELTKGIFSYDLTLRSKIYRKDPWSRKITKWMLGSRGPFHLRWAKLNPFHKAAVIKDPTGSFLTEYLYNQFQVKPVIVIKHPASFIASIKRLQWWQNMERITDKPYLIADYFANDTEFINRDYADPLVSSAAYWRATYKVLLEQASKYPNWQIITHEQLSQEPLKVFSNLYEKLHLPWSPAVENKIVKLTNNKGSGEAKVGVVQDFNRNSAEIFKLRRNSLSLAERTKIFEIVEDVALSIYSRESFAID